MTLTKDGQVISLENPNHAEAFKGAGWTEANASARIAPTQEEEPEKKPVRKTKKQEK